MIPASLTIIDGTRLTQERARAARGTDAPALAALAVLTLFFIAAGLVAIAMGGLRPIMTDLTRIFIPGPSDEANARLFADALAEGSDAAQRAAREDASHLAGMIARFTEISPRLWAAMQGDMRRLIDEARAQRGYADMADITRQGYSEEAIELYLARQNPESATAQAEGDAA